MTGMFDWINTPGPARIVTALNAVGEVRFVGGCVRDSLLGLPPGKAGRTDIDLATTLEPPAMMAALDAAGISFVPTGIDHGTVTAIIDHIPYEITSLRADVSTDGRRATVAFTTDWAQDAARRDFTLNALYLDAQGKIYDFADGQADLKAGRVRFIGDPVDRIREDYLRILRFLRFSARFSADLDPDGWAACQSHQAGLGQLSKERIWQEVAKTFAAPRAPLAFHRAAPAGVLAAICPASSDPALFARVHRASGGAVSAPLGVASLWPGADRAALQTAFKPSKAILDQAGWVGEAAATVRNGADIRAVLYHHGRAVSADAVWLAAGLAATENGQGGQDFARLAQAAQAEDIPVLPLKGADLVARGISPGPEIGRIMKKFEGAWIAAGFPADAPTLERLINAALDDASFES